MGTDNQTISFPSEFAREFKLKKNSTGVDREHSNGTTNQGS